MNTKIFYGSDLKKAANIIQVGGIIAIPTETVYGLAADALNKEAIKKIFIAKGRPMDNPLIVHVSSISQAKSLVANFPINAEKLVAKFWPGPLTIILPKSDIIPNEVSAGLDTVAIRMPKHSLTLKLIDECKVPLAAPSANLSGSPSPTCASHVLNDLDGKIDGIIDGGDCLVGLESTVITLTEKTPKLLRPGGITKEEIESVVGKIEVHNAVLNKLDKNEKIISPGLKYKHYAPKSKVIILNGTSKKYINYINSLSEKNIAALCFDEDKKGLDVFNVSYGKEKDYKQQANLLFDSLRVFDEKNFDIIYAHGTEPKGIGLAVYNRLIRSAGFEVINLE